MLCKLSSLPSQRKVEDVLEEFTNSCSKRTTEDTAKEKRVLVITANMQEVTVKMVNHLRIMIEEAEKRCDDTQTKRLFVIILHFPPSMFVKACYPTVFLRGWNHIYLETIGYALDDAFLNVKDWLQLSCFGPRSAHLPKTTLAVSTTLNAFLKKSQVVTAVSSLAPFTTRPDGSFSQPMMPKERMNALQELFERKRVGGVLCELFESYWTPHVMVKYLERAAVSTYLRESTLSISDSLVTEFRSKFLDFLVYIVVKINEDFNLDIIFGNDEQETLQVITQLFLDILKLSPLPELSQLRSLCASLLQDNQKQHHVTSFPFFRLISRRMDVLVAQSKEEVYQKLNLLDEDGFHCFGQKEIYTRLCKTVERRIAALLHVS